MPEEREANDLILDVLSGQQSEVRLMRAQVERLQRVAREARIDRAYAERCGLPFARAIAEALDALETGDLGEEEA